MKVCISVYLQFFHYRCYSIINSMNLSKYVQDLYNQSSFSDCPFTNEEIDELEETNEILVYLPESVSIQELCDQFGFDSNVNFENENLIANVMTSEYQWFICSASPTPELMYKTAHQAQDEYEKRGLHGMDFRRYLAFAKTYEWKFGELPDQTYWTFLLSGSYDRSGVSIIGVDRNNVLSHHGWMKDFKAKFCGSRYVVLPPRIEKTSETKKLQRAYRNKLTDEGKEATVDKS